MKKALLMGLAIWLICPMALAEDLTFDERVASLKQAIDENTQASDKVKQYMKTVLLPYCSDPVLVAEVKKQNANPVSKEDIAAIDAKWKAAEDFLPIHEKLTSNPCAKRIQAIAEKESAIGETFVMDNQGVNVGQNDITSDYFQGDEAKWTDTYQKAGVWVGKDALDQSTFTKLQHVSLPIFDGDGTIVGAICFGLITQNL